MEFAKMTLIKGKIRNYWMTKTRLGVGASCEVYEGMDEKDKNQKYAIKLIRRTREISHEDQLIVEREISNLRLLKHVNIISLEDFVEQEDAIYIILEFCETDLEKIIKTTNYSKVIEKENDCFIFEHWSQMIGFTISIFEAFRELTKNEIIHRDLKPSNILIKFTFI